MRRVSIHLIPPVRSFVIASAFAFLVAAIACNRSAAQEQASGAAADKDEAEEKLQPLELADGRLVLQFPARWEKREPSVRIIEAELAVPAKEKEDGETEKDADAGRLTIMQAGGSIEANVDRWIGQFKQPDGKPSREAAKIEKKEYDGLAVHLVDLSGTFVDRRGPAAPATEKEDHRLLGAIVETKGGGNYFVKFTGPQETVEQNAKAFWRALEELEWK